MESDNYDVTKMCSDLATALNLIESKNDVMRFLKALVDKTKIKENRKYIATEFDVVVQKNKTLEDMLDCALKTPSFKMTRLIKEMIASKINCEKLEEKYPDVIELLWKEVKTHYEMTTLYADVDSKTKDLDDDTNKKHYKLEPYKHPGKTENYFKYKYICLHLQSILLTPQVLFRKILYACITGLPEKFFDFTKFHDKLYEIENLANLINDLILESSIILKEFLDKIKTIIDEERFSDLNKKFVPACLNGATGLVIIHISSCLQNTIQNLIFATANAGRVPYFKYVVYYENSFKVYPEKINLIEFYVRIFKKIVALGTNIPCLENYYRFKRDDKIVQAFLTEDFLLKSTQQIEENVIMIFAPIDGYIKILEEEFHEINEERCKSSIMLDVSFDEGCILIDKYRYILLELSKKVSNEYFPIGQLMQEDCINSLKLLVSELMDTILMQLVNQHIYENETICEAFEIFAVRCTEVPINAEALMEISSYMAKISETLLPELEEKIEQSVLINAKLIEMTTLTDDHILLNIVTVNWLNKIPSLLEQNSLILENCKTDFEDKLLQAVDVFNSKVNEVLPFLLILDNMDNINNTTDYIKQMSSFIVSIKELDKDLSWINNEEAIFKFPLSTYTEFDELKHYVYPFYHLLKLCAKWRQKYKVWMDGPFEDLNFLVAEKKVDELLKELTKIEKQYKAELRQQVADNVLRRFKGSVDDPDPLNLPAPLKICKYSIQEINDFIPNLIIMRIMCNDALLSRHWEEMSNIAGFDMAPNAGTTLRNMATPDIRKNIDQFEIITSGAVKEKQLLTSLLEMQTEWENILFSVSTYKKTNIQVLTQLDEIHIVLDEHLIKTLVMRGTVFVKPYEVQVKGWYEKIIRITQTLEECEKVQTAWLKLLPIFSAKNIIKQMPNENYLFEQVDDIYKNHIATIRGCPKVITTAGCVGLLENMQTCQKLLENITKGVATYLEQKRLFFPRFFFLSNEELLEILSETKDPKLVQCHLKKIFNGIDALNFNDNSEVIAMRSKEGEEIDLNAIGTKTAQGCVEKWLIQIEQEMKHSLRNEFVKNINKFDEPDLKKWPGQVTHVASLITWTKNVEQSLNVNNLKELNQYYDSNLKALSNLFWDNLDNLAKINLKTLIVLKIHMKRSIEDLIQKNIKSKNEFAWLAQLRYYWDDDCFVKLVNTSTKYLYEYYGSSDRLVMTSQIKRSFITLMSAFNLYLFGAIEGATCAGKTETIKDLAKSLAVQCAIFNCQNGVDYKITGNYLKGALSSGIWICFDDFNRIKSDVLSVVAQQVSSILETIRSGAQIAIFEGTELKINAGCFVCVTINNSDCCDQRSEIPVNLKKHFRPICVSLPDLTQITEVSLYSCGFINARSLSCKIISTNQLCSELLTQSNHYDYSIRTIKSVLKAAWNYKQAKPDQNEEVMILNSILEVYKIKLFANDMVLFEGIIADLFPNHITPYQNHHDVDFKNKIIQSCLDQNLQTPESFVNKIIQTKQAISLRQGLILLGDPFSGKTSTLKVLSNVLNSGNLACTFINPKSITINQLYGRFDAIANEWIDGVITKYFAQFVIDDSHHTKLMIFDGPLDSIWAENIHSLLDDNKKLCLASGKIIFPTESMTFVFEVVDLQQSSPAIVSRCGVVYMEPNNLGWEILLKSWMPNCNNQKWFVGNEALVEDLFHWLIPPVLEFINKHCKSVCKNNTKISLVDNMMKLVGDLLDDACADSCEKDDHKHYKGWIQATFVYAGIWALASNIVADSQEKFDEFYRALWKDHNSYPDSFERLEIPMPAEGLLYDYSFNYKMKGNWKYLPEVLKNAKIEHALDVHKILVPTVDTGRYISLAETLIRHKRPFLFIGPSGTGKTYYIRHLLTNQLSHDNFDHALINLTVRMSSNQLQDLIVSKLNKKKFAHYGPPKGKFYVFFIDDLHVSEQEKFGARPTLELIRQFFDHHNWYDLKSSHAIYLQDCIFVGAMCFDNGHYKIACPRFLRHFSVFSLNELSNECVAKIFCNILFLSWKNNGFPSDVMSTVTQLVNMNLEVYKKVIANFKPTPAKMHYVFNLRDFSRVIFGCCLLKKESADDKKIFVKIWTHEIIRVFYDRLVDDDDREWLYLIIKQCLEINIKEDINQIFENLSSKESFNNLLFGSYLTGNKRYEEIKDINQLHDIAISAYKNMDVDRLKKTDLVMFKSALENLSKICRILATPYGDGLLIGISGSGRQTLTKLASAMYNYKLFQPQITNAYTIEQWKEDLKEILKESGGKGRNVVFLLSECQMKKEEFLQDIDCLLKSGEVPNIWQIDEHQEVLEMVRLVAQGGNRNLDVSASTVFSFFIKQCHRNLHIILCFSLNMVLFRNLLRSYTSIINFCTIIWFDDWPDDAIDDIATKWMAKADNISEEIKERIIIAFKHFHCTIKPICANFFEKTGRKVYVTSGLYLELIKSFIDLINSKQIKIKIDKERYITGLEKLMEAANQIVAMQKNLAEYQVSLKDMTIKAAEMTEQIAKETIEVELASDLVKKDEQIANVQAAKAQALKLECEADLAQAIPILEDAISALNTLKPTDITLVKSMKNPPDAIKLVMAAVCVIRDVKPDRIPDPSTGRKIIDYWGPSKRILGDMNFLQNLKDFDKDHINPDIMVKIRKEYLPHKDFKPHVVAKASSAAEGLCKWIIAMDMYDAVAKEVAPKKEKLEAAEKEYATTLAILTEKKEQVTKLEEKLANLNQALKEATQKQQKLQANVDLCSSKLQRAEKLIGGLGEEKRRWTISTDNLTSKNTNLPGDIVLSCGVISYLTSFSSEFRSTTVLDWHKFIINLSIPCSDDYNFINLGCNIKIQNWQLNGLPKDPHSIENSIIMDNAKRWPLFIDPQCQANAWIKNFEKYNNIECTKFSYRDHMDVLKRCIEFGRPCLLENIAEELDPSIDPILLKEIYKKDDSNSMIHLSGMSLTYNHDFRLYITTKLVNPHYQPDTFNKSTIINFNMTLQGLEDQLLDILVTREKPELQRKKDDLVKGSAKNIAALQKLDDDILRTLAETKGDILEDECAIKFLDYSKTLSQNITQKENAGKEAETVIERQRCDYKPVAVHSAFLYDCTSNLININPMYQYSLAWFIKLYVNSIETTNRSRHLQIRLRFLKDAFTYKLFTNVVLSLFEKDKLMFAFFLCTRVLLSQKRLKTDEFEFLLNTKTIDAALVPNKPDWLSNLAWANIIKSKYLNNFQDFFASFLENETFWNQYQETCQPENLPLPSPLQKLDDFQKLILIKILRPDRFICCAKKFVKEHLGEKFTVPPLFDVTTPFAMSSCIHPLIFILSPGLDPLGALIKFAETKGYNNKLFTLSLGQNQNAVAENLIEECQKNGSWVCLQNCHLAKSWMSTLERVWENINLEDANTNFRLWLTSSPTEVFPNSILVNGIKMVLEAPFGLQQKITRLYLNEPIKDEAFYSGCPGKDVVFTRLLYATAYFHALIQERKRFGPFGWNVPYDFDDGDFNVSVEQMRVFINEYVDPYEMIRYFIGCCNYGGRINDEWDLRLINTILDDFVNKDIAEKANYMIALPKQYDYGVCMQHINNLPQNHQAETFGLHNNASFDRNLKEFDMIIKSLNKIQHHKHTKIDTGFDDHLLISMVNDLLIKIPNPFNVECKYQNDPLNTILIQETLRFDGLIKEIYQSLDCILKAVQGLIVFSPTIDSIAKSIMIGCVPKEWCKISYATKKTLANYISNMSERVQFFRNWHQNGMPKTYWLSSFFQPRSFLTAVKQTHARAHLIYINELKFDFEVLKKDVDFEETDNGVCVNGLFCVGARWDCTNGVIGELVLNVMTHTMPVIYIKIVRREQFDENQRYKCPLYETTDRQRCVFEILLNTNQPVAHWIKRNVALVCEID